MSERPKLLDLFCGAGGCSVGYARAGFDVVGVDNEHHPDYPFRMVVADVLEILAVPEFLQGFDVFAASPPCQAYSDLKTSWNAKEHPELIEPVRAALAATDKPYIIENVEGAPLEHPVKLCGSMFGLGIPGYQLRRHRLFEIGNTNMHVMQPQCSHEGPVVGVYGDHLRSRGHWRKGADFPGQDKVKLAREALGIDWMGWSDLSQSIPPAYTEFLGEQLIDQMAAAA